MIEKEEETVGGSQDGGGIWLSEYRGLWWNALGAAAVMVVATGGGMGGGVGMWRKALVNLNKFCKGDFLKYSSIKIIG